MTTATDEMKWPHDPLTKGKHNNNTNNYNK